MAQRKQAFNHNQKKTLLCSKTSVQKIVKISQNLVRLYRDANLGRQEKQKKQKWKCFKRKTEKKKGKKATLEKRNKNKRSVIGLAIRRKGLLRDI